MKGGHPLNAVGAALLVLVIARAFCYSQSLIWLREKHEADWIALGKPALFNSSIWNDAKVKWLFLTDGFLKFKDARLNMYTYITWCLTVLFARPAFLLVTGRLHT